jgi:type I restriction enzyme, S subunit
VRRNEERKWAQPRGLRFFWRDCDRESAAEMISGVKRKMNVPEGFQQTEVVVIPKDWEVVAIGENVTVNSGESPSKFKILASGIPYFKVDELNNSSKYAEKSRYCIEYCKSVPEGSLIFPKRGASIFLNKIRILKQPSYMDTNLMTLTVSKNWEHEYIYYQLLYIGLWKVADITSVPQINNKHIIPFQIPLPPTITEQTAIAAALSDMDALIEGVEKLLEKKRWIKQGAMQELLTGKRRVSGFESKKGFQQTEVGAIPKDWRIANLGELVEKFVNGGTPSTQHSEYWNGNIPWITGADILNQKIVAVRRYITNEAVQNSSTNVIKQGKLLFVSRTGVGKMATAPFDIAISQDFTGIYNKPEILNISYLFWFLNFTQKELLAQNQGTSIQGITRSTLSSIKIPIPPTKSEQAAIAAVLSDMDSEIEQLETQLTKYRQLKTGMMQELLTGKKRLV